MATQLNDLAEHINTVIWISGAIVGGLFFICGVLVGLVWKDLRKKIEDIKNEAKKFSEWFIKTGEQGGRLVTEKLHFEWCKEQQANCQACESYRLLLDWRTAMMEKGGIMLKTEHSVLCKEITKEVTDHFCERLDEMLKHHRQLVTAELNLLRVELTKKREG